MSGCINKWSKNTFGISFYLFQGPTKMASNWQPAFDIKRYEKATGFMYTTHCIKLVQNERLHNYSVQTMLCHHKWLMMNLLTWNLVRSVRFSKFDNYILQILSFYYLCSLLYTTVSPETKLHLLDLKLEQHHGWIILGRICLFGQNHIFSNQHTIKPI